MMTYLEYNPYMVKKMNRRVEIVEENKTKSQLRKQEREEKKDQREKDRDEKIEDKRQWKQDKPRPLKDLLLALASVLKWLSIAAGVVGLVYKLFF